MTKAFLSSLDQVPGGKTEGDRRIRLGIIGLVVDAVQDAVEAVRTRTHQTVQTFAVELGLDLFLVARGHGGDEIRVDQAAFQKASVPVQFHLVR